MNLSLPLDVLVMLDTLSSHDGLQSMTQPRYFMLKLELMVLPFNTTLKSEILFHLHFESKSIDSHFPGCNESLISMSQLFIELSSVANFVSLTLGSLSENKIKLSSVYEIKLQFIVISEKFSLIYIFCKHLATAILF